MTTPPPLPVSPPPLPLNVDQSSITVRTYRIFLLILIIWNYVTLIIVFNSVHSLPPELQLYKQSIADADHISGYYKFLSAIGIGVLFAKLVGIIGLYQFWSFARPFLVTLLVFCFLFGLFLNRVSIDSALVNFFLDTGILLQGIVLAWIYLSPISQKFTKPTAIDKRSSS